MFRPITLLGPVLALALVALSACSEGPVRHSAPPSTPAASAQPKATPAPAPATDSDDQSLRLNGPSGSDSSCRAQCERDFNICMDSTVARSAGSTLDSNRSGPFTPLDNCQYSMRQCLTRCGATP